MSRIFILLEGQDNDVNSRRSYTPKFLNRSNYNSLEFSWYLIHWNCWYLCYKIISLFFSSAIYSLICSILFHWIFTWSPFPLYVLNFYVSNLFGTCLPKKKKKSFWYSLLLYHIFRIDLFDFLQLSMCLIITFFFSFVFP